MCLKSVIQSVAFRTLGAVTFGAYKVIFVGQVHFRDWPPPGPRFPVLLSDGERDRGGIRPSPSTQLLSARPETRS